MKASNNDSKSNNNNNNKLGKEPDAKLVANALKLVREIEIAKIESKIAEKREELKRCEQRVRVLQCIIDTCEKLAKERGTTPEEEYQKMHNAAAAVVRAGLLPAISRRPQLLGDISNLFKAMDEADEKSAGEIK